MVSNKLITYQIINSLRIMNDYLYPSNGKKNKITLFVVVVKLIQRLAQAEHQLYNNVSLVLLSMLAYIITTGGKIKSDCFRPPSYYRNPCRCD